MKSLQDFQIISQLAEGSYATVYKVRHIHTQKLYALKEMSKAKLIHAQKTEAAVQERKIHSSLQHPGIVQFISSFQSAQFLYIVLELSECGDLLTATNLKGLCISAVCEQILHALFYLHNVAGVVHLDLKPENILLFPNGVVKICDFGCAQWINEGVESGKKRNLGTVQYACPHLLRGEWECVGFGCDLWSFGCVVWFLLERARRESIEAVGESEERENEERESEEGKSEERESEERESEERVCEEERQTVAKSSEVRSTNVAQKNQQNTDQGNTASEQNTSKDTNVSAAAGNRSSTIDLVTERSLMGKSQNELSPTSTRTTIKSLETKSITTNKSIPTNKSVPAHTAQLLHPFSASSEYLSMKKVLEFDRARKKPLGERQVLVGVDFDEVVFGHLYLTEERIGKIVALLSALCPLWEMGV